MNPLNILISLHRGYGMGDAVQMSAVLRHVAKYRPQWIVDFQAEEGRHVVGEGIVRNTFTYGDPYPSSHYNGEIQILLFDTWANWGDRPNTRVSSCLHERFGLEWDRECGTYQVNVPISAMDTAAGILGPLWRSGKSRGHRGDNVVAVHYEGDSSPSKKNLSHIQAERICRHIESIGHMPLLLDWRNTSPLPDRDQAHTVGRLTASNKWGGNAQVNCAIIRQCKAFVGIDSGPSKCASSTDTPALVVWTGHHPAPFHDPAPNTTHLVPVGYHGLEPVCGDPSVIKFFEDNYTIRQYQDDLVLEANRWLTEVLA